MSKTQQDDGYGVTQLTFSLSYTDMMTQQCYGLPTKTNALWGFFLCIALSGFLRRSLADMLFLDLEEVSVDVSFEGHGKSALGLQPLDLPRSVHEEIHTAITDLLYMYWEFASVIADELVATAEANDDEVRLLSLAEKLRTLARR